MKEKQYSITRRELADIAGVSVDVVRMEEKKGTFGTALSIFEWAIGKRLLSGSVIIDQQEAQMEALGYVPMEEHEFSA